MEMFDFIAGLMLGMFFYHVFLRRLVNNPRYQRFGEMLKKEIRDGAGKVKESDEAVRREKE